MSALRFEGIRVHIAGRDVLQDVSLELAPGEVVALAGPNGAGKTTLLRVASRLLVPDGGRVEVAGRPVAALSRRELACELAVVPQQIHVPFPFRALEVVLMGRSPHLGLLGFESAADIERARDALRRVGIAPLEDRSVLELSGGELQLVLVARALVQDPRVLLLDEPTAHLDLRHRVAVLELVRELAAEGRSALVVSHDLNLAARCCDRLALLTGGRLLACGAPRDVLTAEHLRATFGIDAEIATAPDGTPLVLPRSPAQPRMLASPRANTADRRGR